MSSTEDLPPSWRRGLVTDLDPATCRVRLQLPDADGVLTDWLPVVVPFSMGARAFWMPRVGSQVVALLDENLEDGAVVGAIYSSADSPTQTDPSVFAVEFEDGTLLSYDPTAQALRAVVMGSVDVQAMGKVRIQTMDALELVACGPVTIQALDDCAVKASGALTVEAYGALTVNSWDVAVVNAAATVAITSVGAVTIAAPSVSITAAVSITGSLSVTGAASVTGTTTLTGDLGMTGTATVATDAVIGGKPFLTHTHISRPNGTPTGPVI